MIADFRKNCIGTVSFQGKFDGMRKPQVFIVYPMKTDHTKAMVQSDTRIGIIEMATGRILMSPPRATGSYGVHLVFAKPAGKLDSAELLLLKANIYGTASDKAGDNGMAVYCDNSAAAKVFG